MAKTSKAAVMRTAAEYMRRLGHSRSGAMREAWLYHRSTEPKPRKRKRK